MFAVATTTPPHHITSHHINQNTHRSALTEQRREGENKSSPIPAVQSNGSSRTARVRPHPHANMQRYPELCGTTNSAPPAPAPALAPAPLTALLLLLLRSKAGSLSSRDAPLQQPKAERGKVAEAAGSSRQQRCRVEKVSDIPSNGNGCGRHFVHLHNEWCVSEADGTEAKTV